MRFYLKCILGFIIQLIEKIELHDYALNENDISKKIIDTHELNSVEVMTDTGFEYATHIHKTQPYTVYIMELDNGYVLECADNHIVFDDNYNEVFVKNLYINQKILTNDGLHSVIKIQKMPYKLCMYDMTISSNNHRYYTNGILSHNTTTMAACLAWFLCFNDSKNAMVLANKQATAIEIVDKIIQIFRGLPFFLKPGALNFGKMGLTLDNGCKLLSSATTASTSIGFTIHWLMVDEFAHIPKNIIEPFWRSVYPTLSSSKLSRCTVISTPNGQNMFYDIYSKSSMGTSENSFKGLRIDYWRVPGHDDAWADAMRRDFGADLFAQEFELQFSVNSKMLLKGSDLQFMNRIKRDYIYKDLYAGRMLENEKIKWHPNFDPLTIKQSDKFLFCIDLAEGKEYEDLVKASDKPNDYGVINIFKLVPASLANIRSRNKDKKIETKDCFRAIQIGIYVDNEHDEEYLANITSNLMYNVFNTQEFDNVRLLVEMNFQGKNYVTHLKNHEEFYDDIIIKTYHSEPIPGEKRKKKYGYKTTTTKEYYCKKSAKLIEDRRIIPNETETILQLGSFGKIKGDKYGGIASHDDISITVLNTIPRAFEQENFIGWVEDLLVNHENVFYKYELNNLIQLWELNNPEISDTKFNILYNNSTNINYNYINSPKTYSQIMNRR